MDPVESTELKLNTVVPSALSGRAASLLSALPLRWKRWLYALLALLTIGLLFIGSLNWLLPYALKTALPNWLKENTQRELFIAKVDFNPFTLHLLIEDLSFKDTDRATLAQIKTIEFDGNWSSLPRMLWSANKLTISHPQINIRMSPNGDLDWSRFIDSLIPPKPEIERSNSVPLLELNNISIVNAAVVLDINHENDERKHIELSPLSFQLNRLTTLPREQSNYSFAAKLNDQTEITWRGRVGLNPVMSTGQLTIANMSANRLWALSRLNLPLAVNGSIGLRADYNAVVGEHFFSMGITNGILNLNKLQVDDTTNKNELRIAAIEIAPIAASLAHVNEGGTVREGIDLAPVGVKITDTQLRTDATEGSTMAIKQIAIEPVSIDLKARNINSPAIRFEKIIGQLKRNSNGRITLPFSQLKVLAPTDTLEKDNKQQPVLSNKNTPWTIAVENISAEDASLELHDHSFAVPQHAMVQADMEIGLQINAAEKASLQLDSRRFVLRNLSVRDALDSSKAWLDIEKLQLPSFRTDLLANTIKLPKFSIFKPRIALVRENSAAFDLERKLETTPNHITDTSTPSAAPNTGNDASIVQLDGVYLENGNIAIEDRTLTSPIKADLNQVRMNVEPMEIGGSKPIRAHLSADIGSGGKTSLLLRYDQLKSSGEAKITLNQLLLPPFSAYLNQNTRLQLLSGTLNSHGNLSFASGKNAKLGYQGYVAVHDINLVDERTKKPFIQWKELSSKNLNVTQSISGLSVQLADLLLDQARSSIVINPDRTVNLAQIGKLQQDGIAPVTEPVARAMPDKKSADATSAPVKARIDRIQISGSHLEFADLSLAPQFGTQISHLSGLIVGLSSEPLTQAEISLEGRVDEYGSAQLSGNIAAFNPSERTDLKAAFRNLEMSKLTPYAGKFAGRAIQSGKLSLDLDYQINNRELLGENQVIINNLVLGDRIDSPSAANLPLDLAIAMLRDSHGKIDLELPVKGSLADPQFSFGGLIWKAFINVIRKAVTAPFRAVGSLFGHGDEHLESIAFEPGTARLMPPEHEKLTLLVKEISAKPQIKLLIGGRYDPDRDREALADYFLKLDISKRAGITIPATSESLVISLTDDSVRAALDEIVAESDNDEIAKLRTQYQSQPESAVAGLLQGLRQRLTTQGRKEKVSAQNQYYNTLFTRLRALQVVPDTAYTTLADARAEAVRKASTQTNQLDPTRIEVIKSQPVETSEPDKVLTTLSLDVKNK